MASGAGTLEVLARLLGAAMLPLKQQLDDRGPDAVLADLGLRLPAGISSQGAVAAEFAAVATAAQKIADDAPKLVQAIDSGDVAQISSVGAQLVGNIAGLAQSLANVGNAIASAANAAGLTPEQQGYLAMFAQKLPRRLLDFLVVEHLAEKIPHAFALLKVFGVLERHARGAELDDPIAPGYVARAIHFDRFIQLLSNPTKLLDELYGWGQASFDGAALFKKMEEIFGNDLQMPANLLAPESLPPIFEAYLFSLELDASHSPPGLLLNLRPSAKGDYQTELELGELWKFTMAAEGEFVADLEARVQPPFSVELVPPSGNVEFDVNFGLAAEGSQPILLVGKAKDPGGKETSRLEAKRLAVSFGMTARTEGGKFHAEPVVIAEVKGGRLVLDFSSGDGFLAKLLSGVKVDAEFDVGARWSPNHGIRFDGSSALEVEIPVNLSLGPVKLPRLYLASGLQDSAIPLEVSAGIAAQLGPLAVTVDRLGMTATLSFPDGGGNLGIADFDLDFKAPTGVGLRIDGGGFKGGGFLEFEPDKGRYTGILQLAFQGLVNVTAIGLITTKLPDGSQGFSLLILISTEFTPVQLGFGFTLNGVGGLLGLNRTMKTERLKQSILDNSLDHVMFPADPIANSAQIVSDLREIFPPREKQFVFGPMALLGWGTPTLMRLELGVLVEVPDPVRIAILGVLRVILPDEKAALIKIQVNFAGIIDFERKEVFFLANLFDSRLLFLTLSGGMVFQLNWGSDPRFLLSVGGFHPAYDAGKHQLPSVDRLTVHLLTGNPRLKIETYFAVTSNTVQFGARLELYAGAGPFNVYGWLGFDALFQFSPFFFDVAVSAGLQVRAGTSPILGVDVSLQLRGPTPWNAKGKGRFSILFFSFTVRFNVTWGKDRDTTLPDVEVWPKLQAALSEAGNWSAEFPARSSQLVTLREIETAPDEVVVHPFGTVTVRQKVLPLDVEIQKFGAARPADGQVFSIEGISTEDPITGDPEDDLPIDPVHEEFVPAHFFELDDSEKLDRKSFERLEAGSSLRQSELITTGDVLTREVEYEEVVWDGEVRNQLKIVKMPQGLFARLRRGSFVSRAELALEKRPPGSLLGTPAVVIDPVDFVVARVDDMTIYDAQSQGLTQVQAHARMQSLILEKPELAGELQVLAQSEVDG